MSDRFDTAFNDAAARLAGAVSQGWGFDDNGYRLLLSRLTSMVVARYSALRGEADYIAAGALASFVDAARRRRLVAHPKPAAYLVLVTHNEARQALRRRRPETSPLSDVAATTGMMPDPTEAIGRVDAVNDVAALISAALEADDRVAVRVLQSYCDAAAQGDPSYRQVADDARVTHPTVAAVLRYAKKWLGERGPWQRLPAAP